MLPRNHVHHPFRKEGLIVRLTHRGKRTSHLQVTKRFPSQVKERWSMDFLTDTLLLNGRRVRTDTVVGNRSRHRSLNGVDFTLTRTKVSASLEHVGKRGGYPKIKKVDNGTELA
ncbi:hypothetical protein PJI16_10680 [Nitrospira sp. MA-1]|nr:hypothetical protein [Nitrospira sp. MA-1]